jgi:hypothetical protein
VFGVLVLSDMVALAPAGVGLRLRPRYQRPVVGVLGRPATGIEGDVEPRFVPRRRGAAVSKFLQDITCVFGRPRAACTRRLYSVQTSCCMCIHPSQSVLEGTGVVMNPSYFGVLQSYCRRRAVGVV